MAWCEENGVDYVFGLARNSRLTDRLQPALALAEARLRESGQPARLFTEFRYLTRKTWSRRRRVVGKAERLLGRGEAGANPRFVVTSLSAAAVDRRDLCGTLYCARGDLENRIKECQLDLFADRTSAQTMRAYQLRLKLLKIGAQVRLSTRRVRVSMASGSPHTAESTRAHARLCA